MSGAAGTWDITMTSVLGEMTAIVTLLGDGTTYMGVVDGEPGSAEIRDVWTNGVDLSFTLRVTRPAPSDFAIAATILGDTMTGTSKAKYLPEAQLSGRRRVEGAAAPAAPAPAPVAADESPVSVPIYSTGPAPTLTEGIAPGLVDFGKPVTPDTTALEFELPPPPPPGIAPAPPPPA